MVYRRMGEPPSSEGGLQVRVTCPSPALACRFWGADGGTGSSNGPMVYVVETSWTRGPGPFRLSNCRVPRKPPARDATIRANPIVHAIRWRGTAEPRL